MPLISGHLESAMSAVKSRFGYHQPPQHSEPPESALKPAKSCTSPELLLKSAARDNNMFLLSSYKDKSSRFDDDDGEVASDVGARSFEFREDPSFWKDHNVQVIIRLRPLSGTEISVQGSNRCVKQDSSQSVTWTGHPESRFTFDLVADETVTQEMLFRVAGVPMVENCVEGYNSCMFAYGQTGSGKTHTMLGDIEGGARRHNVNCGMTPRVFDYLFSRIQKERDVRSEEKLKFTCRCSFLEIYNEQIFDLLDPSTNNLQIREDSKKGVYVENLTEIEVTSARDVIQQLIQGAANRKVAATNMNRASSRSHSVFTCVIESKWESQGVTRHRFARLNLVDLAGSERQKSSGAEGERLKEATNINKSLSTLGLVIMNLVNISNGKSQHVPYRDSKLTFLLQDSLGGNAKTIIIANISPSSCCSLETLSTLKFAQRAKFIKNHAIVNEDASGDVLALRLENQNLKKEVSRLRCLVNGGGENQDADIMSLAFPGSPGSLKWDGLRGLSSPLASERKSSRRKEYEVALVGALRREKDKDIALQALAAESQAAVQLAKQREDEIQSLKLRLRFREAGIKRLESVASGKISAEEHLLKEREEYMKEIEVLRAQVDRNQEATRFAMENLRLNEEIRRLKSFCEEGERESMLEQISVLENKLLEALDWKFMHESEPANIQKEVPVAVMDVPNDDDFLSSNQLFGKGPASPWRTSMNDEIEFLRIQAIQNQSETDSLRKKLDLCIQEKEKLERRVHDLTEELEAERLSKEIVIAEKEKNWPHELPSLLNNHVPVVGQNDLKTMVDAIAVAIEREAEAHERAVSTSKENDELRSKLKVLIEDNNKLIDLYESAVTENRKNSEGTRKSQESSAQDGESRQIEVATDDELKVKAAELKNLEHQLAEMHEENDKLLGLYEKAMQERDELKRVLASDQCKQVGSKGDSSSPEKLVQIDESRCLRFGEASPVSVDDELIGEETTNFGVQTDNNVSLDSNRCMSPEKVVQIDDGQCLIGEPSPVPVHGELLVEGSASFGVQTDSDDHDLEGHPVDQCSLEETSLYDVHVHESLDQSLFDLAKCSYSVSDPVAEDMMDLDDVQGPEKQDGTELSENLSNLVEGLEPLSMPSENEQDRGTDSEMQASEVIPVNLAEYLNKLKAKLVQAQEKLSYSANTVHTFSAAERAIIEVDALMEKIGKLECRIQEKQQESAHLKSLSSELQARKDLANNKLSALRQSLTSFSSSMSYFEQREALARSRLNASSQHLSQKKEELTKLQVSKKELTDALLKLKQSETELKTSLENLKLKVDEANKKLESDKVLFAIDSNVDKPTDLSQRIWQVSGKATELLTFEEEKTKLQNQVKLNREKLKEARKEAEAVNMKLSKIDSAIQVLEAELQKETAPVEEMERKLQQIIQEREMISEMKENGMNELENMIIEYYQSLFDAGLKEEEMKVVDEEVVAESHRMESLQRAKTEALRRKAEAMEAMPVNYSGNCFVSEKMEAYISDVQMCVAEMNLLLEQL